MQVTDSLLKMPRPWWNMSSQEKFQMEKSIPLLSYGILKNTILAWRIPGMGKPGGLPSMGSHRVGQDWSDLAAAGLKPPPDGRLLTAWWSILHSRERVLERKSSRNPQMSEDIGIEGRQALQAPWPLSATLSLHYKTPHSSPDVRLGHSLEGISPLWPPLPSKAIQLFFKFLKRWEYQSTLPASWEICMQVKRQQPFPSPLRESEKWNWSRSVVRTHGDPMDCSPPGSSIHGIF